MPTNPTAYRVFIASPSGLDDERRTFRETIHKHNEADGYARNAIFVPVGWEETLGGRRRPQSAINEELDACDYFVLVLWDRWGTAPDDTGKYTSGTEEEFDRAAKLFKKRKLREIVVLFKAVDAKQLSDPGDQLKKVLEFRKKLEKTKEIFFHSFDDIGKFQDLLSKFLHKWVRDDEDGALAKKKPRRPKGGGDVLAPKESPAQPLQPALSPAIGKMLDEAESLADKGKLTEAEVLFSRAIIKSRSPSVLNSYGWFLQRLGRMSQAKEMHEQALAIAREVGDRQGEGTALGKLGIAYKNLGEPRKAIEFYEQHRAIAREIGDRRGEGNALWNSALAYYKLGQKADAMDRAEAALAIREAIEDPGAAKVRAALAKWRGESGK
ncbi:MAG: tetratricopeptide repeat protein [Verrucomicrobia bacterium]|nr:tetratricopeptide repeat protein [Verrucomicrobiota bacterium]